MDELKVKPEYKCLSEDIIKYLPDEVAEIDPFPVFVEKERKEGE